MSLAGDEIKVLLGEAKRFESEGSNDSLKHALEIYDRIIEAAPEPFYYSERSRLKYRMHGEKADLIDSAIADISKAIELEPDRGYYYRLRGDYQLYKISTNSPPYSLQAFSQLTDDYRSCISKSPTEAAPWLSLIAANILSQDFDEAISLYGQCANYANDNTDKLGRSLLGCIALIMAGDKVGEDEIGILAGEGSELSFIHPYVTGIIPYLNFVKESNERKWSEISRILELYIRHYDSWLVKNIMLEKTKLREPAAAAPAGKTSGSVKGKSEKKMAWLWVPGLILAFLGLISRCGSTDYEPTATYRPAYTINFKDLAIPTYYPMPSFVYPTVPPNATSILEFLDSLSPQPFAETAELEILSVTKIVVPDGYATLTARGEPGVKYDISVIYSSGPSKASGLGPKTADKYGDVSWTWHVGPKTKEGVWQIIVSGGGEKESTYFSVTKLGG